MTVGRRDISTAIALVCLCAMAALAHGRPLVTTRGALTETLWEQTAAVQLCPVGDAAAMARACAVLLTDAAVLARRSQAARALYDTRFDLRHTLTHLVGEQQRCLSTR